MRSPKELEGRWTFSCASDPAIKAKSFFLLMIRFGLLSLFLFLSISVSSAAGNCLLLEARISAMMPEKAEWALIAKDVKTDKVIVKAGNASSVPLVPASLVKLFTAGAALNHAELHGKLNMKTTVVHDGNVRDGTLEGNLYMVGKGNAFLSVDEITTVAKNLAAKGIHRVTGNLVADDTFFIRKWLERSRKGAGYSPAGALGIDLHTVALTVAPTEEGNPPKVLVAPPNDSVRLAVAARTSGVEATSINITQVDDESYRVDGNMPPGAESVKQRFPLQEPALAAVRVFASALREQGVEVLGGVMQGKASGGEQVLAEIDGPDLLEVLQQMNVNSLNVVADNMLLFLGAQMHGPPGTRENGVQAIKLFLSTLGLPTTEGNIADGSGLDVNNRVTTEFIVEYLTKVTRKKWFEAFYDTLPRAGLDGTLRQINYKDERFRVKSGRLENAFALAGYGTDGRGRLISFAFIVNTPGAAVNLEDIGADVIRQLGTEVLQ